ncbi:MAG TPA: YceI family protein [Casimicrobiaceae bacterium]|jgi:hypothetical protein
MRDTLWRVTAAIFAAALISGCASSAFRTTAEGAERPAGFPDAFYQRAAERGEPVFRIDSTRSRVVIEVRRGGSLAQAGHDHVVVSHDVKGAVAPNDGRADLYVRLDRLVVDEPEALSEAGFDTHISEAAIAGTRANMLGRVLRADEHPFVLISVGGVDANRFVDVAITLNGVTRTTRLAADIHMNADELGISGVLAMAQTDFGITPLSLLAGAIQVQDGLNVRFSIQARREAVVADRRLQ